MQPVIGERLSATGSGLLLVDKPAGITSHDVVARCRRAVASKRVGHAGTLDPFATGLLVLGIGQATRLLPYLDAEPKVYEARIRFGFETNTDDATGEETARGALPDWAMLPAALTAMTGRTLQVPPAFSAKHVDGQRAYAIARHGGTVELAPVEIEVFNWQVVDHDDESLSVVVTCAGGTYVRALARDLGRLLQSAAHCDTLRRVRSGACSIRDAVPFEALERGALAAGSFELQSPLPALQAMTVVHIDATAEASIRLGRAIAADTDGGRAVLVGAVNEIVAIAVRTSFGTWQPRVVLPRGDDA
jgi:tRNA pseudouridine55 synthase